MKKLSKILGLTGFILFLGGVVFKDLHYPGANILIVVGSAIGIFYFISSLFVKENIEGNKTSLLNSYFTSIAMIFSQLAFVFKTLHWPGGGPLLAVSCILFFIMAILLVITISTNDGDKFIPSTLYSFVALYMIAILIFFAIPGFWVAG